ncbi:MAG: hypothetical protein U0Q15_02285 [Kineosporiaceae bacterium]
MSAVAGAGIAVAGEMAVDLSGPASEPDASEVGARLKAFDEPQDPRSALERYYSSLQAGDAAAAYDLLSTDRKRDVGDKNSWVKVVTSESYRRVRVVSITSPSPDESLGVVSYRADTSTGKCEDRIVRRAIVKEPKGWRVDEINVLNRRACLMSSRIP